MLLKRCDGGFTFFVDSLQVSNHLLELSNLRLGLSVEGEGTERGVGEREREVDRDRERLSDSIIVFILILEIAHNGLGLQ